MLRKLGETWACGQATINKAKKTEEKFSGPRGRPVFEKQLCLPTIASGISAAWIYCVHMLLLPFGWVEMTHGATHAPELMTSLISFVTQF
jgi:hypothetical protein